MYKELKGLNWKTQKAQYYFPALNTLTIMQTPNTLRKCYECRGKRYRAINHVSGRITAMTCPKCKGEGCVLD